MSAKPNFDDLRRLRIEALGAGIGSGRWIKAAAALMDAFPAIYDTAKAMNERAHCLRTDAARDVLAERARQIAAEGYAPEHDDEHVNGEIAAMAAFYAMPDGARDWPATETGYGDTLGEAIRPEGWEGKTGDRRRELVKAGALILAEIERLDRAAAQQVAAA